jgi:hypothetical protein
MRRGQIEGDEIPKNCKLDLVAGNLSGTDDNEMNYVSGTLLGRIGNRGTY